MNKKYVLFDLDGTITDSSEGITKSVGYALEALGIEEKSMDMLKKYIGPPLDESFMRFHGLDKDRALEAVGLYRKRYNDIGIYENRLFDGVATMLSELKNKGYIVALATCKPEIYVPRILTYFGIDKLFDISVGSELEGGKRRHKNEVIEEVFRNIIEKYNLNSQNYAEDSEAYGHIMDDVRAASVMIGDRRDDILGAKATGIDSIGVRYGFAEPEELELAGADIIVDCVEDIASAVARL